MKPPTTVTELDLGQVEEVIARVEQVLGENVAQPLRLMLGWCLSLQSLLQEKNLSLARRRRLVFGARTERTRDVLPEDEAQPAGEAEPGEASKESTAEPEPPSSDTTKKNRGPRKGHGRNPAAAYTGCDHVIVTHDALSAGDSCPDCQNGTLYRLKQWVMKVRLVGQPPIGGTRFEQEQLRCGTCGKLHVAPLPEEAGPDKHDASVPSIIGTLRYGEGLPWKRIERIQRAAGIPMPASVQWQLVRDALAHGPMAAYEQLVHETAQGDLMHNDDTHMQVLEWAAKAKKGEPLREDAPHRSGVFTTNILSIAPERPTIALFFTGVRHSGENLRELLEQRVDTESLPIQMCDALACNTSEDLPTIVANCLSHGRRNFVDVAAAFPDQVRHVLECFREVYRTDAASKRFHLSDEKRMLLHQRRSGPTLDDLHRWLTEQLEQRMVEPNSSLGHAMQYLLRHWKKLTLFLHRPGVPLDNNLCEQALKMAIRHRKNSLFYKTQRGADVGDVYMSLIHTCYFAGADPFHYLTELQRNEHKVKADPARWLPWNYRDQLPGS